MPSNKNEIKDQEKKYKYPALFEIYDCMKGMETVINRLAKKVRELPNIDENGHSECPFVEDLYAEKEEAMEDVVNGLKELRLYKKYRDEDIVHSRNILKTIQTKGKDLHLDRAKEKFSFAQLDQEYYIKKKIHLRDDLKALITRTEKTLNLAKARKWPGGKPKRRNHQPLLLGAGMSGPGGNNFAGSAPTAPALGRPFGVQINSLMSLGPVNGKGVK